MTRTLLLGAALLVGTTALLRADEPVTLANVEAPEPNSADEPFAETFSMDRAVRFLDSASLNWQQSWQCFTCHTNFAYLMARPTFSADAPAHKEVRKYAEALVSQRWEEVGPRSHAEVVAMAASLALNDGATSKKLHPLTRQALDRMWTVQREAGDWAWPTRCAWPPMESDEHYGVTLAAIGTGEAPDGYAKTPAAQAGLAKIRAFLKHNPSPDLHHKAMVLWASTSVDGLMTTADQTATIKGLLAAERPAGGWAFAALYPWKRGDGKEQDMETSDGYGTGFVIYVLRKAGVPATEPALQRGIAWLKTHQRASGRWFTRSLNKDNEHFISHAGSAFAVMALTACDVLERIRWDAVEARKAAAADPTIKDAESPPVRAYLAEQKRRRFNSISSLRRRIEQFQGDQSKQDLLPILKEQLASLESKPLEEVNFDSAYGYQPATGLVGYSRKVRLLQNTGDGKSVIEVAGTALLVGGLETSTYAGGKFLTLDKAILIGPAAPDQTVLGAKRTVYTATLVDVDSMIGATPSKTP